MGDGLALAGDGVLEDVDGVLHRRPVQTHLQRVDAGRHILSQQVAGLRLQLLSEGGDLLRAQTCTQNIRLYLKPRTPSRFYYELD